MLKLADGADEIDLIQVVDRFGMLVVAQRHLHPLDHQQIPDAQDMGGQDVALECQPVAVTGVHMDHGFHAFAADQRTAGQGAHAHHPIVHVRYDDGVHAALQPTRAGDQIRNIDTLGGVHLGQNDKLSRGQAFLKIHGFRFPLSLAVQPKCRVFLRQCGNSDPRIPPG